MKTRCPWLNLKNPVYVKYHDREWGRPVRDDGLLFEMLCLEGAQAGLSWEIILNKRENYRKAFAGFDAVKLSRFTDARLERLMLDPGIVRNRLKIFSVRKNARALLAYQKRNPSFSRFLWGFAPPGGPQNKYVTRTPESDRMSKELKRLGFKFVGSTICYAFMQATGMVDDHSADCFRFAGARPARSRSGHKPRKER